MMTRWEDFLGGLACSCTVRCNAITDRTYIHVTWEQRNGQLYTATFDPGRGRNHSMWELVVLGERMRERVERLMMAQAFDDTVAT